MKPERIFSYAAFAVLVLLFTTNDVVAADSKNANQGRLVARVEGFVDQGLFRAEITEMPPDPKGGWTNRVLEIRCIKGCDHSVVYRETIPLDPIAAFRLTAVSHQFITLWEAGNADNIKIYDVGAGGIRKVLDTRNKSAPQFGFAEDGAPIVIVEDPDAPVPSSNYRTRGVLWEWNGSTYIPIDNKN